MDRDRALAHALDVFLRYGYRKSSMEDVARAVGVSRQWMYQQFGTKEALFAAGVEHELRATSADAAAALRAGGSLEDSLVRAMDEWNGRYVERWAASPHAAEVLDSAVSEHAPIITAHLDRFRDALVELLREAGGDAGVPSADDRAFTLVQASHAIKHRVTTRRAFLDEVRAVVRVICAGIERTDTNAQPGED